MDNYYKNCKFYDENDNILSDFSLKVEDGSRYLINKYVTSDMKVLELGARYGTVSVCLNYLLNEPVTQLLCVEPDNTVINSLKKNRDINNCEFNIFNGAISKNELYCCYNGCGWETKTYIEPPSGLKSIKISTLPIDKIQETYNIQFDCLLADCEGFLLQFITENDDFFNNLKCVIYEEDCNISHPINNSYIDYNIVENFLLSKGFTHIEVFKDFIGLNNHIWLK